MQTTEAQDKYFEKIVKDLTDYFMVDPPTDKESAESFARTCLKLTRIQGYEMGMDYMLEVMNKTK